MNLTRNACGTLAAICAWMILELVLKNRQCRLLLHPTCNFLLGDVICFLPFMYII